MRQRNAKVLKANFKYLGLGFVAIRLARRDARTEIYQADESGLEIFLGYADGMSDWLEDAAEQALQRAEFWAPEPEPICYGTYCEPSYNPEEEWIADLDFARSLGS
jgi:hypothetical protein